MIRMLRGDLLTCGFPTFVAVFTAANLLLFQGPLYAFAASTVDSSTWSGLRNLLMLSALQVVLMVIVLTATSLLSIRVTKAVCIVVLVGNALALYFIHTYHVLLDKAMIGNVFNTDRREAAELFDPWIIGYVLALGVVPALVVVKTTIVDSRRLARALLLLCTVVLGGVLVYAGSPTWLWFDKQAKQLGGLMLPWSYAANTVRHFQASADANRRQEPLPPLHFAAPADRAQKTIVVLVIGEAARAGNFSLYGYQRNTNPELAQTDVIALPDARACATYTSASIRCMLSSEGSSAPADVSQETLPNYLQRFGVDVIWRSNNWGAPPLKVRLQQHLEDIRKTCSGADCTRLDYDEGLLHGLKDVLTQSRSRRILLVLHQAGSHGPLYFRKYPASFERFRPVCKSVDLGACSEASLVNAYDNTILYTDHFLADTIKVLQDVPDAASTMIYLSDHGESLGEHGFYLHGAPNSIAPVVQRNVPFLVWMSPAFSRERELSARDILARGPFGDDNIFHSVLGAFDASSAVYRPRLDLFHHSGQRARR